MFLCEALYCIVRRFGVLISLFCLFYMFVLYIESTCFVGSVKKLLCAAKDAVLHLEYCAIVQNVMSRRGRGLPGKYHRMKKALTGLHRLPCVDPNGIICTVNPGVKRQVHHTFIPNHQ